MQRKIIKWVAITLGSIVVLIVAATVALNLPPVQRYIKDTALQMLCREFNTTITLDEVDVSVINGHVGLYGLSINDLAGEKMLDVDTLYAGFDLWKALTQRKAELENIKLIGATASLYKNSPDSAANYQFLLDAVKKDEAQDDTDSTKHEPAFQFDIKDAQASNLDITWQDRSKPGTYTKVKLDNAKCDRSSDVTRIKVNGLTLVTENNKPRKNEGKPNRGAFDAGHLDILADADVVMHHKKDHPTEIELKELQAEDRGSGLKLNSMHCNAVIDKGHATVRDIEIVSRSTTLSIDSVNFTLPDSTHTLAYQSSTVKGNVLLADISQPFAPVLKKFKMPLNLSVKVSGEGQTMRFGDIVVTNPDKRLCVKANGIITPLGHVKEGQQRTIHFNITSMYARKGVKEQILAYFPVKESMMGLIKSTGDISYHGTLTVPKKHVVMNGTLSTVAGSLAFNFDIDNANKYLSGHASTNQFALGRIISVPDFKNIAFDATFNFSIASKKKAQELHRHTGKLPLGWVKGTASEATYKKLTLHHIVWDITSDGDIAKGVAGVEGNIADVMCEFSFVNTDFEKSLKCKPSFKFNKLADKLKGVKDKVKDKIKEKFTRKKTS